MFSVKPRLRMPGWHELCEQPCVEMVYAHDDSAVTKALSGSELPYMVVVVAVEMVKTCRALSVGK
jgi:hypothetical protein